VSCCTLRVIPLISLKEVVVLNDKDSVLQVNPLESIQAQNQQVLDHDIRQYESTGSRTLEQTVGLIHQFSNLHRPPDVSKVKTYKKKNHCYDVVKSHDLKKCKGIRLLLALRQFSIAHVELFYCLKCNTLLDLY